jgi:ATP-dependent helicase HrpA
MSVSPLPRDILSKISPIVAERLLSIVDSSRGESTDTGRKTRDKQLRAPSENTVKREHRDFTDKIKLGGLLFDLEKTSGNKKMVILPWETFRLARKNLDRDSGLAYKGLLASIRHRNFRLLEGEKLETILRMQDWLDVENDLSRDWPKSVNFAIMQEGAIPTGNDENSRASTEGSRTGASTVDMESFKKLVANLDHVLQVATPKGKDKRLGFVTLYTDGAGIFWFRVSKGFHTALNESIASLENLVDASADVSIPAESKEKIGALYRKLSAFFE